MTEKEERKSILFDLENRLNCNAIDRESLVLWRIAELRARGILATPYLTWHRDQNGKPCDYRISVRLPDGGREDLSEALVLS